MVKKVLDLDNGLCSVSCAEAVTTCQPLIEIIPPTCPDNCSNQGKCVNLSYCDALEKENIRNYGNETGDYKESCGTNANVSRGFNQTGACACFQGFVGLNCALVGRNNALVLAAALSAGLIALIVILAILGAALAGGGAAAVAGGVVSNSDPVIIDSPLYEANNASGSNPLQGDAYSAFEL